MSTNGYTRVAVYNGNRWEMEDIPAQTFLDEALVSAFPDLRGARFTEERDDVRKEIRYTFSKTSGTKGASL